MKFVSYRSPPVIEVSLVVQFQRIPFLNTLNIVKFLEWFAQKENWHFHEQPYQPPTFETDQAGIHSHQLSVGPPTKDHSFSLYNVDRNRLVNVQADRFGLRWIRNPGDEYIRYTSIKALFLQEFRRFSDWLLLAGEGYPVIQQCEVQYVNAVDHPDPTSLFNFIDLSNFREAEGIQFSTSQRLTDKREIGRLYLEAQTQQIVEYFESTPYQKKVLKVFLTFRGKPSIAGPEGIDRHLDRGHEAIVTTFADCLSEYGRTFWGETRHAKW